MMQFNWFSKKGSISSQRSEELKNENSIISENYGIDHWFNAVLDNCNYSVWGVDDHLNLIFFNRYFAGLILSINGKTLKTGDNFIDFCFQEHKQSWIDRYQQALQNESFTIFDVIHSGNKDLYLEISFKPITKDGLG